MDIFLYVLLLFTFFKHVPIFSDCNFHTRVTAQILYCFIIIGRLNYVYVVNEY